MDSFIPWLGGKKLLRGEIVKRFPQNIDRYVEVFGGAAWVLFYRQQYAKQEVYNDINGELVNLFRMVKYHPAAIIEELKFTLNASQTFLDFKNNKNIDGMTEIQRAARFFYLIRQSYGAKLKEYGANYRDISSFLNDMNKIAQRLAQVVIQNKSFEKILKQYDKEGTLFYCDPPYYKTEKMYDTNNFIFDEKQHIILRDILSEIKGNFVLTYNDDEFIRELYQHFKIEEVERSSNLSICNGKRGKYKELIITN